MKQAIQRAKTAAAAASYRHTMREIAYREKQRIKNTTNGEYISYDSDTGKHQVKLTAGKIINARSITNAGLGEGDRVVVSLDQQTFKSMPRSF